MSDVYLIGSPVKMIEGEAIQWSVTFRGASSLSSQDATVLLVKEGADNEDITSEVFISGDSHTVSGGALLLKKLTARDGDAGETYLVVVEALVDSTNFEKRKFEIKVVDDAS